MKNYTTKIESKKTIGEITELLTENYANRIMVENDEKRNPKAIIFSLIVKGKEVSFLLEAKVDATYRAMVADKKVTKSHKNQEQAERTAWRNLKEYLQIKLAFIAVEENKEVRMLDMQKEFFSDMISDDRKTIFEIFRKNEQKLLAQ